MAEDDAPGFGDNRLHPLQIASARDAAFRASELQREVEDELRTKGRELADAERDYRRALSTEILRLHAGGKGLAITTCADVARGDDDVSELRHAYKIATANFEATKQQAFRRGSDRRDVDTLLNWSMKRDLRTDTPPPGWDRQTGEVIGERDRDHDPTTPALSGPGTPRRR